MHVLRHVDEITAEAEALRGLELRAESHRIDIGLD
jgi:hypothetical protein